MATLAQPTVALVRKANDSFDTDPQTALYNASIRLVFDQWPENREPASVLAKVVLLNRLYNTSVYDVYTVARNIVAIEPDERLAAGDPSLVEDLARVTIQDGQRRFYSFATKYCFWHRPDDYVIYDSYVDDALWAYKRETSFAEFRRYDLSSDYRDFLRVIEAFREHFGLQAVSRRELDRFLWTVGERLRQSSGG